MPGERAGKGDDIFVGVAFMWVLLAGKPQQLGPRISQQHLELHACQRGCFHRCAQEQVARKPGDAVGAEQLSVRHRQRPSAGNPPDIAGDRGALQDEGDRLVLHAERKRLAEMGNRLGAIAQRLVGIAGVVVAGGVHFVGGNCLREQLCGRPVVAGGLRHQAEKVQALHMIGLARENVPANLLRFVEAAHSVETACFGGEAANAHAREAGSSCAFAGLVQ